MFCFTDIAYPCALLSAYASGSLNIRGMGFSWKPWGFFLPPFDHPVSVIELNDVDVHSVIT